MLCKGGTGTVVNSGAEQSRHGGCRAANAGSTIVTRAHSLLRALLAAISLLFLPFLLVAPAHAGDDFLDPEDAFVFSAAMAAPDRLDVHFRVAPAYYMYRDRFRFSVDPEQAAGVLGEPVFPPGLVQYDPTFDEEMEVYYDQYTLQLPLVPGASEPLTLTVVSQGCADAGLCYPPLDHIITLTPVAGGYRASGDGVLASVPDISQSTPPSAYASDSAAADGTGSVSMPGAGAGAGGASIADTGATGLAQAVGLGDMALADWLKQAHLLEIVVLAALLGLLLSFTPCVLPMVPILLAVLAGDARGGAGLTRWRGFSLAAVFVLGMSLVYTALGVAAGLIGASLAVWLQTPWVLTVFAIALALLALAMFDVFTIQAPTGLQSALNAFLNRIPGGRYGGVFLMGMVSALIVGPCVAAPLAGVLLFISQTGDVVLGGTALFSMAWGSGLLLLLVGASSGALLPKAGPWMDGIKHLFGILLLATAWWMVNSVLPAAILILGWAALALFSAVLLGAFAPVEAGSGPGQALRKSLGLMLALWAALLIISVAAGGRDLLQPLKPFTAPAATSGSTVTAQASPVPEFVQVNSSAELDHILANTDKPVMLDFYADWCVSCIEMERFTFSDPAVAQRMARFTLVQADVTRNLPEHRELLKRFNLFGPPGIIFFDADGTQRDDARVVGFQNAERFGAVLDQVLAKAGLAL
ncbi:MAG TPA: protein-disulfide reductase DsbD [Burkholderiaceae bacterium]|nr:protein-disulfide reductase DsbD [Burkholderiaceae bacterium]